ncbi:FtsW/RodA/SpoVE family cell cycle protein [Cytobacillus praedii]|uniref:FtsW/RodA/SpoVE family cell cycle protein n=1 Tax=Cytobacillus praedii TaxID=1742358 RepID=UPI00070B5277|nr:FtsW/RodA/SpoVE family cell cycle protein [Cytobacillus praedii]
MNSSRFDEFLSKVTSKVKSKEAHKMIKKELTNHLVELSQTFQKGGVSKDEADDKAIKEMGNPFTIGDNLNRIHKPKMDWLLIFLFIIIAGISFLPLVGGVPEMAIFNTFFIGRQAIWLTLSILVIVGILFFDYRKLTKSWVFFFGSGLALLIFTNISGYTTNGIKTWISFFGYRMNVTVLSLFFLFLAWAGIFNKINTFKSWKKQILLFFLFWSPIFFYMMLPNIMFSIIYFFCIGSMFAFSQVQKRLAVSIGLVNMAAGLIFLSTLITSYRKDYFFIRLAAFINPDADPNGAGFMYILVKDILSNSGWFGRGLYNDINIQQFLPAAHTDFVFPYLVYSLGWLFGILLCIILLIFILRISINALITKDLFGRLLVIGGATLFTVPTCWNVLMGFGIVPIMGVSLPFISYGGSMLLFYSAILGLILNVYRKKDFVEPTITYLH